MCLASQLGGQDVCVEVCDPSEANESVDGSLCLSQGARVQTCRPSSSAGSDGACPQGLECYRTDLIADEGLCLAVPICSVSTDCKDLTRTVCVGDLVRRLYPNPGLPIHPDHLQCIKATCGTSGSGCPSDESCLRTVIPTVTNAPDICVPNCDSKGRCPPNFVCWYEVSGPSAKPVCIPGLPGYACQSSLDCMLGTCNDTGLGFSVCGVPCQSHADCVPLITPVDVFVCVPDIAGGPGRYCVNQNPFVGSVCFQDDECPQGQQCFMVNPYRELPYGECRLPCDGAGRCPVRGGVEHVCVAGGAGGCFPGRFGLPCADSAGCMTSFSCETVADELAMDAAPTKVCTIPCQADADCDANPWTTVSGYCSNGFCLLGGGPGAPCSRPAHCRGGNFCMLEAGVCVAEPI